VRTFRALPEPATSHPDGSLRLPHWTAHLAGAASAALGLNWAAYAAGYLIQVLFARWMGVDGYGEFAYAFAWITLVALVAGAGLPAALQRFVPGYVARGELGQLVGITRVAHRTPLVAGTLLSLIATAVILLMQAPPVSGTALVAIWILPPAAYISVASAWLRATNHVARAFVPPLLVRVLLILGAAAWFIATGALSSLEALTLALVSFVLVALLQGLWIRAGLTRRAGRSRPEYLLSRWYRTAVPLLLSAAFFWLSERVDILMIGSIAGTAEVGMYAVASRTAAIVASLGNAVSAIASPRISTLLAEGGDVQRHVASAGRLAFWPSVGTAVAVILTGRPILSLFGPAYAEAYPLLCLLAAAAALAAAAGPATVLLEVSGHHMAAVRVAAGATAVNIALNAALIPTFGIQGAAIATTTAIVARLGMVHVACRRRLGLSVIGPLTRPFER